MTCRTVYPVIVLSLLVLTQPLVKGSCVSISISPAIDESATVPATSINYVRNVPIDVCSTLIAANNSTGKEELQTKTTVANSEISKASSESVEDKKKIQQSSKCNSISLSDFESKPNDESFDNTSAIQTALDYLESLGGGVLEIPVGSWYFKGTLLMAEYCSIQGIPCVAREENKGSILRHNPDSSTTAIKFKQYEYYTYGNMLKDLIIRGNDATNIILHLNFTAHMIIDNVSLLYGGTSIRMNGGMLNTFRNVSMVYYRNYGLLIAKSSLADPPVPCLTTTQRFYDCYIGQTTFSNTAIPIKIETETVTDCSFYSQTVESTQNGIMINACNTVCFENIYVENVGSTVAASVFNLGMLDGPEVEPAGWSFRGLTHIRGGYLQGSIFLPDTTAGKNLIYVNSGDIVTVSNLRYINYNRTLTFNPTAIFYKIGFTDCYGMGVVNDLNVETDARVKIRDCGISNGTMYSN